MRSSRSFPLLFVPIIVTTLLLPFTSVYAVNEAEEGIGSGVNNAQRRTETIVNQSTICCACHPLSGADLIVRFDRHAPELANKTCAQFSSEGIYNRESQATICPAAERVIQGSSCTQVTDNSACPPLTNQAGSICAEAAMGESPVVTNPSYANRGTTETAVPFRSLTPVLSVPIPDVNFTPATLSNGTVSVPFLAQYILGIYKFAIAAAALLASIMVVYGGFRYLLGSTLGDIKTGKEIVTNAVIGLIVLLCSYVILRTLNPALVNLQPIELSYVDRVLSGENSWDGQGGSTVSDAGDGSCPQGGGSAARQQLDGKGNFTVLALPKTYKQFAGVWKDVPYGPGLVNNTADYSCRCGCQQGRVGTETCPNMGANNACPDHGSSSEGRVEYNATNNMCVGTIGQGGCGPTSFAVALAYYGVSGGDAGATALADQALFWKQGGDASVNNSPDRAVSNNGWQRVPARELGGEDGSRLDGQLRARAQSHLYDPLDAARDAVRLGSREINRGTGMGFMDRAAAEKGLRTVNVPSGPGRSAAVADQIRNGHPMVFLCEGCHLQLGAGSADKTYGGHFMVIYGVNEGATFFLVSDVGGRDSPKSYLTAETLNGATIKGVKAILPGDGGGGRCRGNGQTSTSTAGVSSRSSSALTTSGGVTPLPFNYAPSSRGWRPNESVILYPERLTREFASVTAVGQRPQLHIYMYLHGGRNGATNAPAQSEYFTRLQTALQSVAGSKNIIVVAPHYYGNTGIPRDFMNGLVIRDVYDAAKAAIIANIPGVRDGDIVDSVIGGHSMANCKSGVLSQAVQTPLPGQRGIVLYDGCLGGEGDYVQPAIYPVPTAGNASGSLYFNTDARGQTLELDHINNVKTKWGLTGDGRASCPTSGYVERIAPGTLCYNRLIGEGANKREIFSFVTHSGHGGSVIPMTKLMFENFYGNVQ